MKSYQAKDRISVDETNFWQKRIVGTGDGYGLGIGIYRRAYTLEDLQKECMISISAF